MNEKMKIPAYIVGAELFMVWLFVIFLLPEPWRGAVVMLIAAPGVGIGIAKIQRRMIYGRTDERIFHKEMIDVLEHQAQTMGEMFGALQVATAANHSLMAKIDRLMFEYCPEEMSPEQIANYEAHQRPKEEEEAVNRALLH